MTVGQARLRGLHGVFSEHGPHVSETGLVVRILDHWSVVVGGYRGGQFPPETCWLTSEILRAEDVCSGRVPGNLQVAVHGLSCGCVAPELACECVPNLSGVASLAVQFSG